MTKLMLLLNVHYQCWLRCKTALETACFGQHNPNSSTYTVVCSNVK